MEKVVEKVIESGIADKFAEKALAYLNSAEAFVSNEVPVYIEELLSFKVFEHLVEYFDGILVWSVIFVISLIIARIIWKKSEEKDDDGEYIVDYKSDRDGMKIVPLIASVFLLVPLLIGICSTRDLVKAYKAAYAPRVYLIDYLRSK